MCTASHCKSSIPYSQSMASQIRQKIYPLTFLQQPGTTKSLRKVPEINRGNEVSVVIKFCVSSKHLVRPLFHLQEFARRVRRFFLTLLKLDCREVLVGPRTAVRVTVVIVLTTQKRFTFLLIRNNIFSSKQSWDTYSEACRFCRRCFLFPPHQLRVRRSQSDFSRFPKEGVCA